MLILKFRLTFRNLLFSSPQGWRRLVLCHCSGRDEGWNCVYLWGSCRTWWFFRICLCCYLTWNISSKRQSLVYIKARINYKIKHDFRLRRYQEVRGEDGEEREGKAELDSQKPAQCTHWFSDFWSGWRDILRLFFEWVIEPQQPRERVMLHTSKNGKNLQNKIKVRIKK